MQADVTQMLHRWSEGDQGAFDQLFPVVYDQLKQLARSRLRRERDGHTLNTTALVHEAYVKLINVNQVQWEGRAHFLAIAARAMRQILVDYAIRRNALKRGGGRQHEALDEERLLPDEEAERLLELDDALHRLEAAHPRPGQAVTLRYFGGLKLEELGAALGVSTATAMRDIRFAQAWLAREWKGELKF